MTTTFSYIWHIKKTYEYELKEDFDSLNDGYVDLGLTSGTLWADKNVGASSTKDDGDYFDFDEAQKQGNVPSMEQFDELLDECEWNWEGKGYEVIGPNGNSIFLPAAGYRSGTDIVDVGSDGFYWLSAANGNSYAYCLWLYSTGVDTYDINRIYGHSVRLVK